MYRETGPTRIVERGAPLIKERDERLDVETAMRALQAKSKAICFFNEIYTKLKQSVLVLEE